MTKSRSSQTKQLGGGRVLIPKYDYGYSLFGDSQNYDKRVRKKLEEESQKWLDEWKSLLDRLVDENDCLTVKSAPFLNEHLKIREGENYNGLGGGGQFLVLETKLDPSQLGYQFWEEVWTHMTAFSLVEADPEGKLDAKTTTYVNKAKDELKTKIQAQKDWVREREPGLAEEEVKIKAEEKLEGILRQEVCSRLRTARTDKGEKEPVMPVPFEEGVTDYVVKISKDKIDKSSIKEAHMVGFNDKASIFSLMYVSTIGERYVFIMEHIKDDLSLDKIVNDVKVDDLIDGTIDIVNVLGKLSRIGGVHRDIKTTNILWIRDKNGKPRPKVGDYGVMRIYKGGNDTRISADKTYSGGKMLVGTPRFFSPKHVNDPQNLDFRDDLYSLFATLYVWITGKSPNPIKPTGNIGSDAEAEGINVGWPPTDAEKTLPVNPYNLAVEDFVKKELRLNPDDRKWYKPWTWISDPKYVFTKGKIRKKLYELSLVIAKAMMYDENWRYQKPAEIVEDLKDVKEGRRGRHVAKTLAEKTDHYKLKARYNGEERKWETVPVYENVLRETKPKELLDLVFSRVDPFYEKDMKSPHVQVHVRRQNRKYVGITAVIAGVAGAAATYLAMNEWVGDLWTKIKDMF